MSPRIHRINIPVPEAGWLTIHRTNRLELVDAWIQMAIASADAAQLPAMRRVAIRAQVRDSLTRPRVLVASDARPSLEAAVTGLVAAGVLKGSDRRYVAGDSLSLGVSTGELEPLLALELTEVS